MKKIKIAVLGAGNMGTALAQVIAQNGYGVHLWNWEGERDPLEQIQQFQENKKYLPGVKLSNRIQAIFDIEQALYDAQVVFFCVSTKAMDSVAQSAAPFIQKGTVVVDVSKGLHPTTFEIIPDFLRKIIGNKKNIHTVGLSGPAVASQMVEGQPTMMVAASKSSTASQKIQKVLQNKSVKIFSSSDLVGTEIGQSLKNVYAIGLGMATGLGLSFNTQAILFTQALKEMVDLVVKMGGKRETIYGLVGLGDLVTTALSDEGRNRRFGAYLGEGKNCEQALALVQQTVEGLSALQCTKKLGKKYKVKMPFAILIDEVVQGRRRPGEAMDNLFQKMK